MRSIHDRAEVGRIFCGLCSKMEEFRSLVRPERNKWGGDEVSHSDGLVTSRKWSSMLTPCVLLDSTALLIAT